jgi:hypothetical protein
LRAASLTSSRRVGILEVGGDVSDVAVRHWI